MKKLFLLVLIFPLCILLFACGLHETDSNSLSEIRLNIQTYKAGKDQVTHPSVVSFDLPWNGYRYWMAYTPYPFSNGEEENPCIAVSNDLFYWDTPSGMVNPVADNEETGCDELKDAHIVYRNDLDRIEIWYLGRLTEKLGGDDSSLLLFRKYSYDGVNWSDYEVMSRTEYLSPSIIWKDNKYYFWGIGYAGYNNAGKFAYLNSEDGKAWINQRDCSIDGKNDNLPVWHGSVSYSDGDYYFVYVENSSNSQNIYCCTSKDGVCFENNNVVVHNNPHSNWGMLYRPFLLVENNDYELFYGVVTENHEWYITKSNGPDLSALTGIKSEDQQKMKPLSTQVTNTHSPTYILKQAFKSFKTGFRIELFLIFPFVFFIHRYLTKRKIKGVFLAGLYILFDAVYVLLLLKPDTTKTVISYLFASLIQGAVMFLSIDRACCLTAKNK